MPYWKRPKIRKVLIIEDNEEHLEFMMDAIQESDADVSICNITNGKEAIEYFSKVSEDNKPDLIILDWNMIGAHGRHIVRAVRGAEATKKTPIAIFTTSDDQSDIDEAHALGCNVYSVKPALFVQGEERTIEDAVVSIVNIWLSDGSNFKLPS